MTHEENVRYLFDIQKDDTSFLCVTLFDPCFDYIEDKLEKLYQKSIALTDQQDCCLYVCFGGMTFIRDASKVSIDPVYGVLRHYLDPSLNEESKDLVSFFKKAKEDARFIQMWLSTFMPLNGRYDDECMSHIPPALRKIADFRWPVDIPYSVPEGKQMTWLKAESIINYYSGLKLLL
jgi:hypothetical protein